MAKLRADIVIAVKRHRKLAWLSLLGALASIALTLWSYNDGAPRAPQEPTPIAATISFQSYSNGPSGQRWALLTVTNSDFGTLYIAAGSCLVELSNQPSSYLDPDWQYPTSIPPRSTATVAIAMPSVEGSWRVRCLVVRGTWRDRVTDILPRWWPTFLDPGSVTHAQGSLDSGWVSE